MACWKSNFAARLPKRHVPKGRAAQGTPCGNHSSARHIYDHTGELTFEALRACPYRFFAQSVLGLRAADELDPEVEKRDYGKWLHEVLHRFHLETDSKE